MTFHYNLKKETTGQIPRCAHTSDFFVGLPDGVDQFHLLQLVQNVASELGLSAAAVNHLGYLVTHTKKVDWQPGAVPIIYRSVQLTATDLNCTEKTIYNREKALHRAGLLQWRDREDHKRFGQRNPETGQIEYAWGVDLTPLGQSYERLVKLNERHLAYISAWRELKASISSVRRSIINKLKWARDLQINVEYLITRFDALTQVRARMPLPAMTDILNQARTIQSELDEIINEQRKSLAEDGDNTPSSTKKISDTSVKNYRLLQSTDSQQSIDIDCNQPVVDDDKDEVGEKYKHGLEHITYEMAIDAASDDFVEHIRPSASSDPYEDLVRAAIARCHDLGIGRFAWVNASAVMGDTAAAVAVIIIDRNRTHPLIPVVNPGGVLRGMTVKAKSGDLHLHRSIYAILKRDSAGGVQ